ETCRTSYEFDTRTVQQILLGFDANFEEYMNGSLEPLTLQDGYEAEKRNGFAYVNKADPEARVKMRRDGLDFCVFLKQGTDDKAGTYSVMNWREKNTFAMSAFYSLLNIAEIMKQQNPNISLETVRETMKIYISSRSRNNPVTGMWGGCEAGGNGSGKSAFGTEEQLIVIEEAVKLLEDEHSNNTYSKTQSVPVGVPALVRRGERRY
ncbi:MAG: hypothetical protein JWM56_202, partial [Candidatus Peribacteria bacterium]|nr:hypothetical protein [Candidatus Peribacteria bacterium]